MDIIAAAVLKKAMSGDIRSISFIAKMMDGPNLKDPMFDQFKLMQSMTLEELDDLIKKGEAELKEEAELMHLL